MTIEEIRDRLDNITTMLLRDPRHMAFEYCLELEKLTDELTLKVEDEEVRKAYGR